MSKPIFIAEIKTQSPFGYNSKYCFYDLMCCANRFGDWISVHTNPLWGGSYEAVEFVRRHTNKPILAKGFHSEEEDIVKALDHGADYVLVVDRVPYPHFRYNGQSIWTKCLFEMHNQPLFEGNLTINPDFKNQKFVCNLRDLNTGDRKNSPEIAVYLEKGLWTCQASFIKSMDDVLPNVSAFIVGEHLVEFTERL
jgi:indole-3-glycerol phosphate synthase